MMKIKLTEPEVEMIMMALEWAAKSAGDHLAGDTAAAFWELSDDIREQAFRRDDDWGSTLAGRTFTVAEDDFIQRGMDAREQAKANSRAQERRNERMMKGTVNPCHPDFMNDPADW